MDDTFGFENDFDQEYEDQSNFNPVLIILIFWNLILKNIKTSSLRDGTLFLVDCSPSMFVKAEVEEKTLFEKCMKVNYILIRIKNFLIWVIKAIQNMYQQKIYGSDRDFLGIVFFGTEKNNTSEDFPHIYTLQVKI